MAPGSQCRMVLKNGKRCPYPSKKSGFCGVHLRSIQSQRKAVDKLIALGKYAAAITALIKLVETLMSLYPKVEPFFRHVRDRLPGVFHSDLDGWHEPDWRLVRRKLEFIKSQKRFEAVQQYRMIVSASLHLDYLM